MIKNYCDCCGKEILKIYKFKYLCHLDSSGKWRGYTDIDGEPVSGREESKDLCLRCYNKIIGKAVRKFTDEQRGY